MIVQLVGPPAAGKSTFAARYVLEHPEFKYCPIDEYRIEFEDEGVAWLELTKDVLSRRNVVVETCGMGWRLAELLNIDTIRRRSLTTVAFRADNCHLLHDRLDERQKRPLPPPFEPEDEHLAIDHMLECWHQIVSPIDYTVIVDTKSKEEVYNKVSQFVNERRLLNRGRQDKRMTQFEVKKPTAKRWRRTDRVKEL